MKQSKWDKNKLGHYRPIRKCKRLTKTFGEICLECNRCGRFNEILKIRLLEKIYNSTIYLIWSLEQNYPECSKWSIKKQLEREIKKYQKLIKKEKK